MNPWQLAAFATICGITAAATTRIANRIARFIHWWWYGQ